MVHLVLKVPAEHQSACHVKPLLAPALQDGHPTSATSPGQAVGTLQNPKPSLVEITGSLKTLRGYTDR